MKHKLRYIGKLLNTKAYLMVRNNISYILYDYSGKKFKIIFFADFAEYDDYNDYRIYVIENNLIKPVFNKSYLLYIITNKKELIRKAKLLYIELYV